MPASKQGKETTAKQTGDHDDVVARGEFVSVLIVVTGVEIN